MDGASSFEYHFGSPSVPVHSTIFLPAFFFSFFFYDTQCPSLHFFIGLFFFLFDYHLCP